MSRCSTSRKSSKSSMSIISHEMSKRNTAQSLWNSIITRQLIWQWSKDSSELRRFTLARNIYSIARSNNVIIALTTNTTKFNANSLEDAKNVTIKITKSEIALRESYHDVSFAKKMNITFDWIHVLDEKSKRKWLHAIYFSESNFDRSHVSTSFRRRSSNETHDLFRLTLTQNSSFYL